MAIRMSFRWEAPPSAIVVNLDSYERRLIAAIGELADHFAAAMEGYAKANAPWVDRTGAARQSIRGFATKEATRVVLYLVGQTDYFPYLELGTRKMAPRPIILPTLERHHAPIMAALRQLVGA